jgi:N-acetylglucosaminyldiphosphoundecaprenol N-acetyl-beta-D-mannosaminyltransferase
MNQENILGYKVTVANASSLVADIDAALQKAGPARWLACLNPHSYVCTLDDQLFSKALHASDFLIADGVGVVIASRFLSGRITQRVTGSDIFEGLNAVMQARGGGSVFFLGSTEDCLDDIRDRFVRDYPAIRLVGTWSPPFKSEWSEEELAEMRRVINLAEPDVLWVGMTAPKQEKWIYSNLPYLKVKFAAAVGAVFDFYTGRVKRSSPIFQMLGLEWLPRLIYQPRRLWRRMIISAPIFIWHIIKFQRKKSKNQKIKNF